MPSAQRTGLAGGPDADRNVGGPVVRVHPARRPSAQRPVLAGGSDADRNVGGPVVHGPPTFLSARSDLED